MRDLLDRLNRIDNIKGLSVYKKDMREAIDYFSKNGEYEFRKEYPLNNLTFEEMKHCYKIVCLKLKTLKMLERKDKYEM